MYLYAVSSVIYMHTHDLEVDGNIREEETNINLLLIVYSPLI